MLESKYVNGKSVPPFDEAVNEIVKGYESDDMGGGLMVIGIQNLEGQVYRILDATGLGTYMNITSDLADIGLEDKYVNGPGRGGYDSLFIIPLEMKRVLIKDNKGGEKGSLH